MIFLKFALLAVLIAFMVIGMVSLFLEFVSFLWKWVTWQLWYKESGAPRPTFDWSVYLEVLCEVLEAIVEASTRGSSNNND